MTISGVVSLTRPMMLPTALADAFLGTGCAGLVMGSVIGWKTFAIACAIAVLLYAAGIVLNDIADVKADRLEACERPLADRTTSILSAVALFTLLAGTALLMAAMRGNTTLILALACFSVAVLYDFSHKKIRILSPFLMGASRGLNVLVAASVYGVTFEIINVNKIILLIAIIYGSYVSAVTFFSLLEEKPAEKSNILLGFVAVLFGIISGIPLMTINSVQFWYYAYAFICISLVVSALFVLLSQERVKYVKYYVPMWIAPLCVLGGLGLLFFSVGDAEMRFLPASSAIILLYPLLTFLFNARLQRAKKSKARDLERSFDA